MNTETHLRNLRAIRATVLTGESRASMSEDMGNAIEAFEQLAAVPDPLDIAYLSMGALQALDADNSKAGAWLNEVAGNPQMETINVMLTACIPAVIRVRAELDGYEGVFLYDVAEPLGMWFINEWFRRETPPSEADAKAQARKWVDE